MIVSGNVKCCIIIFWGRQKPADENSRMVLESKGFIASDSLATISQ